MLKRVANAFNPSEPLTGHPIISVLEMSGNKIEEIKRLIYHLPLC